MEKYLWAHRKEENKNRSIFSKDIKETKQDAKNDLTNKDYDDSKWKTSLFSGQRCNARKNHPFDTHIKGNWQTH